MRRKKRILLLSVLFLSLNGYSQEIIMEQDVNQDTSISTYGKNKSRYFGSNIGIGLPIENANGTKSLNRGASYTFHYGVYYKLKANNFYSLSGQLAYQRSVSSFEVNSPDVYYNELILNNGSVALLNRFNIGKRGNFIGYYLALGGSVDYTIRNKIRSKTDAIDPASDFRFYKVEQFDLKFVNKINYSAEVQIGINKLVLFGKYRLSDAIKSSSGFGLPPTTAGVMFDFGA
jgi:hypothetical protein